MWRLDIDILNRCALVQEDAVLSVGSDDSCEIRLPHLKQCVAFQFVFSGCFVFMTDEHSTRSFFRSAVIERDRVTYKMCAEIPSPFFDRSIEEETLSEIYASPAYAELLRRVQLLQDEHSFSIHDIEPDKVVNGILKCLDEFYWSGRDITLNDVQNEVLSLVWAVWSQVCAYGLLTQVFSNPNISEVMANEPNSVYVEENGKVRLSSLRFATADDMMGLIERIASRGGRRIDQSVPYCDSRLPDGSRVHAIIPPLSLQGPCLTVRKFPRKALEPNDLLERRSVSVEVLKFLESIVRDRSNILISGGTGSGKTTLLNILSSYISQDERIITIEDSAELRLQQPHVIRLESRIPNIEGKGEVTLRELVRNALRMRPDRIVVGECRGGEALDMLQAMNTGHDGSMTTTHANSPIDALRRIETLCLFSGVDLPSRAIREQIAAAIDFVVQQTRFADGARKVTSIQRVDEIDLQTGQFITTPLFEFIPSKEQWYAP